MPMDPRMALRGRRCVLIQRFRPVAEPAWLSQFFRSRFSLPADLFHRVVKLDPMAVRIADGYGVFDAGVKSRWNGFGHLDTVVVEKFDGVFELSVVSQF